MEPDPATILSLYNEQVRRSTGPGGSAAAAGHVVRWVAQAGQGWSGIAWSDLDSGTADQVIADQVAFYARRSESFEWKLYSYDQPPGLGERLLRAGFAAGEPESLMVAPAAAVGGGETGLPPGIRLVLVAGETGLAQLTGVHDQVFGADHGRLRGDLSARLRDAPQAIAMVLAMAGDTPVSAARAEFPPDGCFAGLWGGGTLPQWRGRGIYRALTGYRARLAAQRGYRYLTVDASPMSRPILERLGFSCLAQTTPYTRPASSR